MLEAATLRRDARTLTVSTIDEAREAAQTGFARIPWAALGEEGEALLARDAITVRCIQTADGGVPAQRGRARHHRHRRPRLLTRSGSRAPLGARVTQSGRSVGDGDDGGGWLGGRRRRRCGG